MVLSTGRPNTNPEYPYYSSAPPNGEKTGVEHARPHEHNANKFGGFERAAAAGGAIKLTSDAPEFEKRVYLERMLGRDKRMLLSGYNPNIMFGIR